jgi:hypothetical protein
MTASSDDLLELAIKTIGGHDLWNTLRGIKIDCPLPWSSRHPNGDG